MVEDKEYKMCPRDRIFGDNDGGCVVAMTVLRNW